MRADIPGYCPPRTIFMTARAWISETVGSTTFTFQVPINDPRVEAQRIQQVRYRYPANFMPWRGTCGDAKGAVT